MRIVIDIQGAQAKNRLRGIGRYSHALALALARNAGPHHELWLACNGNLPESITGLQADFYGLIPPERTKIFNIPVPVAESNPANVWRTQAAERIREAFLSSLAPDIVHISSLFEGWADDAVTSVGLLPECPPTAVTLYDLIPLLNPGQYLESNLLFRSAYLRKVQALKRAELLLAISDSSRREALEAIAIPPERVVTIGAGIDDRFRLLDGQHADDDTLLKHGLTRPFIMYTGGIDPRKNIEGLIKAYALLPEAIQKGYQLSIVCSIQEAERQHLTNLAHKQGISDQNLKFTGYVDDDTLILLYNACSLFVFPSFHEGFGLPALEAMACGVPVIGSDSSSIPEVIGRSDALFDPSRPQSIADKITEVLTDPAFGADLIEHGFQQARKFTWDAAAKTTLAAFDACHERLQAQKRSTIAVQRRPRMAYLSPLPPQQTGIADYSAELLPELACYYDITLITEHPADVGDPWLTANFPICSPDWFTEHAHCFDRIIYQLGNSSFHAWQLPLLGDYPGIVVLHDFFLGGVYSWLSGTGVDPDAFPKALYYSHGLAPFLHEAKHGREELPWMYPCSLEPLEQALGVIVHSQFVLALAKNWYGEALSCSMAKIPHLRQLPCGLNRTSARAALGVAEDEILVCSFGLLGTTKLNHRLLDAWQLSSLATNSRCRLVFVGALPENNEYGITIQQRLDAMGGIVTVTGFVDQVIYRQWLAAADIAVQLRNQTRGETSGTVLDCMAYGVSTIVNAHGSLAELPDEALVKLQDSFSDAELCQALEQLANDSVRRNNLARTATDCIRQHHHPAVVGKQYWQYIEHTMQYGPAADRQRLFASLKNCGMQMPPETNDLVSAAAAIAHNHVWQGPRQLLVDISELAQRDAKSGVQRVVRNILVELIRKPPLGYRIEPVCDNGQGGYTYARQHAARLLGFEVPVAFDDPVEIWPGDIFLGLDLYPCGISGLVPCLCSWRQRGVRICFVVYDLLPLLRPDCFIPGGADFFEKWLYNAASQADSLICISDAVATELRTWLHQANLSRPDVPQVGFFHLGADLSLPPADSNNAFSEQDQYILDQCGQHPVFLMVGTIEPRKGHAQALAAMETLWQQGNDAHLYIIGKQGWLVEDLIENLKNHPEQGKRLFWREGVDDNLLTALYAKASALLSLSEGEGFGLPLVEAARYGLPIIARDIPVFREVAGEHAWYFSGCTPEALAISLQAWLTEATLKKVPPSTGITWQSWEQSAGWLMTTILSHNQPAHNVAKRSLQP
ncbi:MAG: glycosyltransferase [Geobacter sp.]|nr:glycosyltransferase [Geobacter sp.]